MKTKIVLAIAGLLLLVVNAAQAQIPSYAEEALLFSRSKPGGSARIQGMGGVQNSLGGDLTSASYNPAGLGMYNRSDFAVTLANDNNSIGTSYLNNDASTSKSNFHVANLGIAFFKGKDGEKGLWGGTLAITYNRTNNFNNTFTYSGRNVNNSIIDYFINDANGTGTSQFNPNSGYNYNTPTGLAYDNYLIGPLTVLNPANDSTRYFTDVSGIPDQKETVTNTGSQHQVNFSYGVNLNDRVFLGGGIGLSSFNFQSKTVYTESFNDPGQPMTFMELDETLALSGTAINATLGTIIRPIDIFQFGISVATPSNYLVTDNYNASMKSVWNNFQYSPGVVLNNKNVSTDIINSAYNLRTPWRVSGGATFFFGKKGFVSADAEWLNYGSAKFSASTTGGNYDGDNNNIRTLYKSVLNLRLGGEYRWNKLRFRAGYSTMPDPFQTPQNSVDRTLTSYSAGVGYRSTSYYVDLAVVMGQGNSSYRPYRVNSADSPLVNLNQTSTNIIVTVGFPF